MLFYWRGLERQIRIEGKVEKTSDKISDDYWNSRHPESQVNSFFSKQSSVIEDEEKIEKELENLKKELDGKGCKRPENWGGFILKPDYFEFWDDGKNRWHLRHVFSKDSNKNWRLKRLYP
jgi:pyridoxamine 5'-phosphate oxidase